MYNMYCCLMYHETTSDVRTKYYVPINKFKEQVKKLKGSSKN